MRVRLSPVLLLLLAPGCVFYSGDDDDPCKYGGGEGDVDPGGGSDYYDPGLRNPDTGECVYYGGGGGGGGGGCDACGNCPPDGAETDPGTGAEAEPEPLPTWGTCEGQCTGLDEATCAATSACRVIYVGGGDTLTFADCWAVDQSGPIQGGGCEGLDATTCSMHDDCSAVHQPACPDGDAAGIEAPEPVDCTTPGAFGFCIAEGENGGPGECEGEVTCDGLLPDCPEGTTPGIADGCYTGYCIPLEDCDSVPACGEIADESSCVERADCVPIYEGVDCECDDVDCTCADWVYASCE